MIAGFVHLVASQVITRLFTFGLNLATARSLTPEAYGVAAVQFHLINTTILFISREGFRRACLRLDHAAAGATRRVLRIAALTVPLGALLSAAVTAALLRSVGAGSDAAYRRALTMQGLAAFVEICSEPLYILASTRLLFGLRVGVETAAMAAKGLLTLALLRTAAAASSSDGGGGVSTGAGTGAGMGMPPAIAFSWGQLAYAGITLAGYAAYFLPQLVKHLSRHQPPQPQCQAQQEGEAQPADCAQAAAGKGAAAAAAAPGTTEGEILRLSGTFTLQAVEKLVLAEGSKMAVAAFQGPRDQGVYGLVNSLGSIVVRTLFQPFEEAAFTAFSKEQQGHASPTPAQLRRQARLLALLVRCITGVGLLAAAFGPAYSHLALLLLYSKRWADTEAALALGLFSQYLVLLAANGILEAFLHSVASRRELHVSNAWLVGFTAAHAALSVAAVRAGGAAGLILADAVNMLLRIAYCLAFVRRRFAAGSSAAAAVSPGDGGDGGGGGGGHAGFRLCQLLPSGATLAALAAAAAATSASRLALLPESAALVQLAQARGISLAPPVLAQALASQPFTVRAGAHVSVGMACLGVVAATAARHERTLVAEVRQLRKGAKGA